MPRTDRLRPLRNCRTTNPLLRRAMNFGNGVPLVPLPGTLTVMR